MPPFEQDRYVESVLASIRQAVGEVELGGMALSFATYSKGFHRAPRNGIDDWNHGNFSRLKKSVEHLMDIKDT